MCTTDNENVGLSPMILLQAVVLRFGRGCTVRFWVLIDQLA